MFGPDVVVHQVISFPVLVLSFLVYVTIGLVPAIGGLYLIYFLLTLPMRRNERARMFLDVLELGLKEGQTAERAITEAGASRDRSFGARFHLLAAYLEKGRRLTDALEEVPRLVPPRVSAMLKVGDRIADIRKVLPACRLALNDAVSQVRGALNYVILVSFLVTPFLMVIPAVIKVKVLPAFKSVFEGLMPGVELPAFTRFVFDSDWVMFVVQTALFLGIWLVTIAYLGGPRLQGWFSALLPGAPDWLAFHLPWRRRRMQRDFSAMLAALLESGIPETEALTLAAQSSANGILQRRAERAGVLVTQGVKLPEALRVLDDSGELQWRLANALRAPGGFVRALTGWLEALDAKAFQLEQTAAQVATTCFVLLNGLMIGSVVIGMFLMLIRIVNTATLW